MAEAVTHRHAACQCDYWAADCRFAHGYSCVDPPAIPTTIGGAFVREPCDNPSRHSSGAALQRGPAVHGVRGTALDDAAPASRWRRCSSPSGHLRCRTAKFIRRSIPTDDRRIPRGCLAYRGTRATSRTAPYSQADPRGALHAAAVVGTTSLKLEASTAISPSNANEPELSS